MTLTTRSGHSIRSCEVSCCCGSKVRCSIDTPPQHWISSTCGVPCTFGCEKLTGRCNWTFIVCVSTEHRLGLRLEAVAWRPRLPRTGPCGRRTPSAAANRPSARRPRRALGPASRRPDEGVHLAGAVDPQAVRAAVEIDVRAGQPQAAALEARGPAHDPSRWRSARIASAAPAGRRGSPSAARSAERFAFRRSERRLRSSDRRRRPVARRAKRVPATAGRRPRTAALPAVAPAGAAVERPSQLAVEPAPFPIAVGRADQRAEDRPCRADSERQAVVPTAAKRFLLPPLPLPPFSRTTPPTASTLLES